MQVDLITREDLEWFREELLKEIILYIKPQPVKKWLTSTDVMEILSCSASTLQTLRSNGTVQSVKIGGRLYYEADHINGLFKL